MDIIEYSLKLESETGFDSIPTIKSHYEHERDLRGYGRYLCPFPHCDYSHPTSHGMWRHVHFGGEHGFAFGKTWKEMKVDLEASNVTGREVDPESPVKLRCSVCGNDMERSQVIKGNPWVHSDEEWPNNYGHEARTSVIETREV